MLPKKRIEELTVREWFTALVNSESVCAEFTLTLVPSEERKQSLIADTIEAGFDCHCEEHGEEKYECLQRQTIVCPDLDETRLMRSLEESAERYPDMEMPENWVDQEGTLPMDIVFATGAAAAEMKMAVAALIEPVFGLKYGLRFVGQIQVEEYLGMLEQGELGTVEDLLGSLDLSTLDGEES